MLVSVALCLSLLVTVGYTVPTNDQDCLPIIRKHRPAILAFYKPVVKSCDMVTVMQSAHLVVKEVTLSYSIEVNLLATLGTYECKDAKVRASYAGEVLQSIEKINSCQ